MVLLISGFLIFNIQAIVLLNIYLSDISALFVNEKSYKISAKIDFCLLVTV